MVPMVLVPVLSLVRIGPNAVRDPYLVRVGPNAVRGPGPPHARQAPAM